MALQVTIGLLGSNKLMRVITKHAAWPATISTQPYVIVVNHPRKPFDACRQRIPEAWGQNLCLQQYFRFAFQKELKATIKWKKVLTSLIHDTKACYTDVVLLRWSIWWALSTCGWILVVNYVQNLWETIRPSNQQQVYNGAVETAATVLGNCVFKIQFFQFRDAYYLSHSLFAFLEWLIIICKAWSYARTVNFTCNFSSALVFLYSGLR